MDYDVIVLGGGTAGLTAALTARHFGASVALIEQESRIGGDCTFYGCVPSKALIETAQVAHELQQAAREGILKAAPAFDFAAVMRHRARIVEQIARDEQDERFTSAGIDVIHARAHFADAHTLELDDSRTLSARRFVVATGSLPALPPLQGLEAVRFLTNKTFFDLQRLPPRLAVLGGGAIGLELAQAFRRLGSEVTVLELADRLLPKDEPEAGEVIAQTLRGEQIDLRLGAQVSAAEERGGEIVLRVDEGEVVCDDLLVAAGRKGSVDSLGLELELERGYVKIDRRCRTSLPHVYAAGDVTGGYQFTHVASHEGRVAGTNAAGKRARLDERVIPWVTFTDPEIAHIGLTESQARERHKRVEAHVFPMRQVDRARILERPAGFVKLVTAARPLLGRTGGGVLVGAQIVGPRAGELIHECALAIRTRCFAGRLAQTIHAYPTMSLAVQQAESQISPVGRVLAPRD
ncbi:MAG: NAD(P)/FAD-dependent oxidoreductase [Actinobacteria bacterium]|nr:NAD(P)/FAD-dependent oxidoreductase [Actinomycetota bacterium]